MHGGIADQVGGNGGAFLGNDFRNAYLIGDCSTLRGGGQSIALFELEGYNPDDVATYASLAGISVPVIKTLTFNPGGLLSLVETPTASNGSNEAPIDIEVAHAMAPDAEIVVYQAPAANELGVNFADDIMHAIAHPSSFGLPFSNQVSSSWSYTPFDDGAQQSLDAMASQGQSFFLDAGDNGQSPFSPGDNRTGGDTTIVGGTVLFDTFGNNAPPPEAAWAQGGGGYFGPLLFSEVGFPSYQTGFVTVNGANKGSMQWRNIPDVSMVAANANNKAIEEVTPTASAWKVRKFS